MTDDTDLAAPVAHVQTRIMAAFTAAVMTFQAGLGEAMSPHAFEEMVMGAAAGLIGKRLGRAAAAR